MSKDGRACGYFLGRKGEAKPDAPPDDYLVLQTVWAEPGALRAIFGFFRSHRDQVKQVKLYLPTDVRIGHLFANPIIELKLSPKMMTKLIDVSENEIYGVTTFYARFRFTPPAENTIHVCLGTACHVRGSQQILNEFEHQLKIKARMITRDGRFGLERVACVGCCALAPVALVNGKVHAGMAPKKVRPLLNKCGKTKSKKDQPA